MANFAIYISAGLGNTVFLLPLIKRLCTIGRVTIITDNPFGSHEIIQSMQPTIVKAQIEISSLSDYTKLIPCFFKKFDVVYLDYFSATRKRIMLSHFIAKRIVTNRIPPTLNERFRQKITFVEPKPGYHEGAQYMRFFDRKFEDSALNESDFSLFETEASRKNLVTIQPGAGNSKTPWKIWPLDKWISLLKQIRHHFPEYELMILGDSTESHLSPYFKQLGSKVTIKIGQTEVKELPNIIKQSRLHIGGDSGITHLAGAVKTPTITIAGGSDPSLFGWHKVNSNKHILIQHELKCHPCYRWYLPNKSRVEHASQCPDFKCIREIQVDEVFSEVNKQLKQYVS